MAVVPVEIPGARYDVIVESGAIARVGQTVLKLTGARKAGVITDSNVGPKLASALVASLEQSGIEAIVAPILAGEEHKNLATLMPVYDALLGAKIERTTPVIALGGGVIGDMAGFVAATVLRGVPFIQVPTSLLAMVDASVGGKTGVDHAAGKNLIGAFHQPIAVIADVQTLKTLPISELRGGLAECIKHDIIRDANGFDDLERNIGRALKLDIDYLTQLVAHNVAIKAKVVAADPFEKGERAHLNLGHTFGHAIESVSQFSYSHGQSVALGMVAAAYTAEKLKLISGEQCKRIVSVIEKAELPTSGMKLDVNTVVDAMAFDKKVKSGKIRLVLPEGIGKAAIREDVSVELMREAIASLKG